MNTLYTLLLSSILCTCASAQSLGLHPPEIDWQKLRTPEGNIIYPAGYEARAQRIANLMHVMRDEHDETVGEKHYRFDMVLQTPNNTINGFVAFAPFRSELFLTPPQQMNLLSSGDWADILTIHEFRHVQQRSNHRRGLTKLFSIIAGQQAWAGSASFTVPNWYTEGDAVIAETMFTPAGRGRTPAFSSTLRALELAGKRYNYARARNNSFRRLIPDHYRYGYNTLTYARQKFGYDVWTSIHQDAAAYKGLFYSFSNNLKDVTGRGTKQLYREALDDLQQRQASDLATRAPFTEGEPLTTNRRGVIDYLYPGQDAAGRLIAYRRGFRLTPALVAIDPQTGTEEVITGIGFQREPYVDVRGRFATWMERRNDPRYVNEGYSDVIVRELESGWQRRLSVRQRYFSPSLSFTGERIVAVEDDVMNGRLNLVILNTADGKLLQTFPLEAVSAALPKFAPAGNTVYYYDRNLNGNAIVALNLTDGERTIIKERSFEPLGNLQVSAAGALIYSSGRDGIDNAYRLDPQTGEVTQLTNVRIGAEYPYVGPAGNLFYAEATQSGMRLRRLQTPRAATKSTLAGIPQGLLPAGPNAMQRPEAYAPEAIDLTSSNEEMTAYPSEDVSDNLYGLRLHSWNVVGNTVAPGIGVAASNALNTVELNASLRYNYNERRASTAFTANYGGWYPVLSATVAAFDRNYSVIYDTDSTLVSRSTEFNQLIFGGTISVPWRWTAGEYSFNLRPALTASLISVGEESEGAVPASFGAGRAQLRFSALRQRARSQVQSRLGVAMLLDYQNTPLDGGLGNSFRFEGRAFLPGLFPTHSFRAHLGFQSESSRNSYQFFDLFQYVRGYDVSFADNSYRVGLDYELPLLYPEIGIWGIYYLSRVRLDLFYDTGRYRIDRLEDQSLSSVGAEVFLDQTLLNTGDLTLGFRAALRLEDHVFGQDDAGTWVFGTVLTQSF